MDAVLSTVVYMCSVALNTWWCEVSHLSWNVNVKEVQHST